MIVSIPYRAGPFHVKTLEVRKEDAEEARADLEEAFSPQGFCDPGDFEGLDDRIASVVQKWEDRQE